MTEAAKQQPQNKEKEELKETPKTPQRPTTIGVYPIPINFLHEPTDGGKCTFERVFIKNIY